MGGNVSLRRVAAWVAAHIHVAIILVLVHTHMRDLELRRQGLAKARIKPTPARVGFAVIIGTAQRRRGKAPGGRDRGVDDDIRGLRGNFGLVRVQACLFDAEAELAIPVPVHVSVLTRLPLWIRILKTAR